MHPTHDDGCRIHPPGRTHRCVATAVAIAFAIAGSAAPTLAGAPPAETREVVLPHVCKGGPTPGAACAPAVSTCGAGSCVVAFERSQSWSGVLTLVVDDDASAFDVGNRARTAITATLTLEVKRKGVSDVLGKTFLDLDGATLTDVLTSLSDTGPHLADGASGASETAVLAAVNSAQMISQLLFQSGDATIAQGLRDLLQTTGTPVITKVSQIQSFGHGPGSPGQDAATVVRAKVRGAVVRP